jgi:hypothetical protein
MCKVYQTSVSPLVRESSSSSQAQVSWVSTALLGIPLAASLVIEPFCEEILLQQFESFLAQRLDLLIDGSRPS